MGVKTLKEMEHVVRAIRAATFTLEDPVCV